MKYVNAGWVAVLSAFLLAAALAMASWAVTTSYWEVLHQEQFSAGTPENVSVHSDGRVILGPSFDLLADTGEPFIWSLAADSKGNVYAGTGNNGKIFQVDADGRLSLWYDSEELEILSLAMGPDGHLYAGTSPTGQIIRISPRGEGEVYYATEQEHVWSLVFDQQGDLYCGTGTEGKIIKVTSKGQGSLFYDSNETNITALVWRQGHLYAGGSGSGLIYKIDSQAKVMMLFDAEEEEICGLVFDVQGQLYAAATSGERPVVRRPPKPEQPAAQEAEGQETSEAFEVNMGETFEPQIGGPSTVYVIDGLGSAQPLWRAPEMAMIFSLGIGPDGDLLVGSGDEGRIYSLASDGSWSLSVDGEEAQILALLSGERGEVMVGTGNLGKVFRLGSQYAKEGALESEVYDAAVVSRWGRISWEANRPKGTAITLQSRSGNSKVPDETWSQWSQKYQQAEGQAITSPAARFIQWRATLSTSEGTTTPSLERVWLAYLQTNVAPKIQGLFVLPPGAEEGQGGALSRRESGNAGFSEGPKASPGDPFAVPEWTASGMRKTSWRAYDPNGDQLEFDLFFRGQEEEKWKSLKEDLRNNSYTWDSHSFPDGMYSLRLVASDSPDNPEEQALSAEMISDAFVVDNTPPKVSLKGQIQGDGRYRITGQANDELSPIVELWYSVDAGDWKSLTSSDSVFDSPQEEFSFSTDMLASGEHIIVVKATDMSGNVGAGKMVLK